MFSWDISPQWQIETDLKKTSEVEVRFISETPERTRLELEHRNIDRHGTGWEGVREGVDANEGWPLYLQRFAKRLATLQPDDPAMRMVFFAVHTLDAQGAKPPSSLAFRDHSIALPAEWTSI